MSSSLIISVSGLRGVIGETLTPDVAMRYAVAFSKTVEENGPFVITRDGRESGKFLADAIHSALNASGRSTIDAAVAATPTTGVLIRELKASGGIQISASHNPGEYNGMKLFSAQGRVVPAQYGKKVLENYKNGTTSWVGFDRLGQKTIVSDTTTAHLNAVLAIVDVEKIRSKNFKVILESNRGAGSILGRRLLEALNCELIQLGGIPDGNFEHIPEPTKDNLASVFEKVKQSNVDVAFCQDPDADRLAIIDENGRYIGEECTVALCAQNVLSKAVSGRTGIVINCATSRMALDIAEQFGFSSCRAAVGEANVVDKMLETGSLFAGEGNGGPIHPQVGLVRDSFVGMALVLELMAATEKTVSRLADELPQYSIVKRKTSFELDKVPAMVKYIQNRYQDQKTDTLDGLRIDWPDAWALVRASNTEPIVRIISEAPTEERANGYCDEIQRLLEELSARPELMNPKN